MNKQSIRQQCFVAFDEGKRPVEIAKENGYSLSTVYTYHDQWKKQRGFPQKHRHSNQGSGWDPIRTVMRTSREIARQLRIPTGTVVDRYLNSQKQIRQLVDTPPDDPQQEVEKTAAEILDHMQILITAGYEFGLSPTATLEMLRDSGMDFRRFRFTKTEPSSLIKTIISKQEKPYPKKNFKLAI